ncbi:hypothetical protein [Streptomyces sp. cg40]|uniref:hypothetical protein n=1 Tax=Streptomyces sp. cg40 TaxID=3419764 RepID=UPI003D0519AB
MLILAQARRTVGVEAALHLPTVMMPVVEDACTALAREDWKHREPPRGILGPAATGAPKDAACSKRRNG